MPEPRLIALAPDGRRRIGHPFPLDSLTPDGGARVDGGHLATPGPIPELRRPGMHLDAGRLSVFQIASTPVITSTGEPERVEDGDWLVDVYPGSADYADQQIEAVPEEGYASLEPVLYASHTPEVGTIDDQGYLTAYQRGEATVEVSQGPLTLTRRVSTAIDAAAEQRIYRGHVPGTLGAHIQDTINARLLGASLPDGHHLFSVANHAAATYVRNPHCWAADVDLTPLAVWNNTSHGAGTTRKCTLVSPRHAIGAVHANYLLPVGAKIRWVAADGTVVERTVVKRTVHPNYIKPDGGEHGLAWPDIGLLTLDADVPESIGFARIFPDNVLHYLPHNYSTNPTHSYTSIPGLKVNRQLQVSAFGSWDLGFGSFRISWPHQTAPHRELYMPGAAHSSSANPHSWYLPAISGDSGNFMGTLIDGTLVVGGLHTGSTWGTSVLEIYDWLNSHMVSDPGSYQLTPIDLSSWPTFTTD